jgi:hypothetical protein
MFSSFTGNAIMVLGNRLRGLSRPVLVEVVYLAGRYLSHALTWDAFQRQLRSDVKTQHRRQSVDIVRGLIGDIETAEGTKIRSLSGDRRFAYISSLDELLRQKIAPSPDNGEVEAALTDLRAQP